MLSSPSVHRFAPEVSNFAPACGPQPLWRCLVKVGARRPLPVLALCPPLHAVDRAIPLDKYSHYTLVPGFASPPYCLTHGTVHADETKKARQGRESLRLALLMSAHSIDTATTRCVKYSPVMRFCIECLFKPGSDAAASFSNIPSASVKVRVRALVPPEPSRETFGVVSKLAPPVSRCISVSSSEAI